MIQIILTQFLLAIIFLITTFFCFTAPGFFLLKKLEVNLDDFLEKYTISTVLGFVIFTISAYILAAINLRFLMWLLPILGIWIMVKFKKDFFQPKFGISKKAFFLAVLLIGVIGQVAVNTPSGFPYKDGIYFWSSHGHDGLWHIALMEEMHKNIFPFQNPEYEGARLQNYHFFVDLLMSEMTRLFRFSNLDVYFRFMPILFSVLLGLGSFYFVKSWAKSEIAGIWAMIFTYFAGSFGYLLYVPTHKSLGGESIFWVSQTQSVLGNPPHAATFIIITIFLFCLLKYLNTRKISYFLLCAILGGVSVEFKVYGGVLILGGLLVLGFSEFVIKKSVQTILLFLATMIIALVIYLPNSVNSQDFLIWQPWWYIRTMVVAPDRLNWIDLELRRQTYIFEHNWKRVIQVETTAFLIFLFGNLGMRFLGFFEAFRQLKSKEFIKPFNLFFLSITAASFIIPVFFLQKGVAWNSIQFNQYFLLLFGFLAALAVTDLLSAIRIKVIKVITIIIVIFFAVPTQIGLLWQFYSNPPLSKVSYQELEALNFLKINSMDDVTILTAPFNKYEKEKYKNPPIPIYAWYDTGYVSAFTRRRTLISDEEQVNIMGYDVKQLVKERENAFESNDPKVLNDFLIKYQVDYIYLAWDQKFIADGELINAQLIYQNKDARVYKVNN